MKTRQHIFWLNLFFVNMRSHCHCPKEGNLPDLRLVSQNHNIIFVEIIANVFVSRFESVTKADFLVPATLKPQPIMHQYRSFINEEQITYCVLKILFLGHSLFALPWSILEEVCRYNFIGHFHTQIVHSHFSLYSLYPFHIAPSAMLH